MICIFHKWMYGKFKQYTEHGFTAGFYSRRICAKCSIIQKNTPILIYIWDFGGDEIEGIRFKKRWNAVGYHSHNAEEAKR